MSTVLCSGNIFSLTPDIFNTLNIKKGELQEETLPKDLIQLYYATVNLSTTLSNAWSSPI
jgi:hypothetical protein